MGLRFRRSIKLAPGLRLNVGLRGMSMTVGPRGASMNFGRRGVHQNLGIPGTGLSVRRRLPAAPARQKAAAPRSTHEIAFKLQSDGSVHIVDSTGEQLPERLHKKAREQNSEMLQSWLEQQCEQWNKGIDEIVGIHLATPSPVGPPAGSLREPFPIPRPAEPAPVVAGWFARLFRSKRERIAQQNAEAFAAFKEDSGAWELSRADHELKQNKRLALFQSEVPQPAENYRAYLSKVFEKVQWPRETSLAIEFDAEATRVWVDVDLPEIEEMPNESATVAARGLKLNIKERTPVQRRREYMAHVHGVIFRVIGECFAPCRASAKSRRLGTLNDRTPPRAPCATST